MTRNDINRIFTDKVAELIGQGFQINPGTMHDLQGEIAKVDLRKGDEILRVVLKRDIVSEWEYCDTFVLRVGRNTDPIRDNWDDTIWMNHLEILFEIKLSRITDNYFVTVEEGQAMAKKRLKRWMLKERQYARELTNDAFKLIALRYVQKQPRMKSCKLADIESVRRINKSNRRGIQPDLECYEITARGKKFRIAAPRH